MVSSAPIAAGYRSFCLFVSASLFFKELANGPLKLSVVLFAPQWVLGGVSNQRFILYYFEEKLMLRRLITRVLRWTSLGLVFASLAAPNRAFAANWNQTSGNGKAFNTDAFWDTNVFPNSVDATANIPVYLTGNQRINLNQPITLGSLTFTNPATGTTSPTLAPSANPLNPANTLTFQVSSGAATLTSTFADSTSTSAPTISAPVILGSELVVEQDNALSDTGGLTFSGGISSAGFALDKNGPGNINLNISSPGFVAPININAGALRLTDNWLPNATGVTVSSGGQLLLGSGSVTDWTIGGAEAVLNLNGVGKTSGASNQGALRFQNNSAVANFNTPIVLQSDSSVDVSGTAVFTLTKEISGPGGLIKSNPGTLVLGGTDANVYGGATTVNNGVFLLSKPDGVNAIPGNITVQNPVGTGQANLKLNASNQIADTSSVTLLQSTGTGTPNGQFTLNGFSETIGSLNSVGGAGIVQNGAAEGTSTLSINAQVDPSSFTGILQDGATAPLAVSILGPQPVSLSGASTYTGGTTVSGSLVVNNTTGSATGTGTVTVTSGGSIGGSGLIGGAVDFVAGVLSPGNSPGTLTLGSASFDLASILNYQLDTPGVVGSGVNDLTEVIGNLALGGVLNVAPLANFGAGQYRIFDYSGSLTSFNLTLGSLPAGYSASFDTSIPGQVNLSVTAVPEPASLALAVMGLAVLGFARVRAKQRLK